MVRISPLAKRIALEHNIAWQEIQGTGHRGKIMKKDVLAYLPENIENDTIKSPAQIEKVEEVPDNVTPYGEIRADSDDTNAEGDLSTDGGILLDSTNLYFEL